VDAVPNKNGVVTIIESVWILYGILSFILICTFCYLALGGLAKSKRWLLPTVALITGIVAVAILLWQLIDKNPGYQNILPVAVITLVATVIICVTLYYQSFRSPMRDDDDFRIQSIGILWIAVTLMAGLAWLFLTVGRDFTSTASSAPIPFATLFAAASVIVAAFGIAFTFVMGSEQSTRNARQQLYQTLEIQSILLFRFESDNPDRVCSLWAKDTAPTNRVEEFCVKQYICQILNLFEMAVRFQIQGVLPKDVFGSWVIWMWELCENKVFHHFWLSKDDLPFNYIRELRSIITKGIAIAQNCDGAEKNETTHRERFFDAVARRLNSPELREWFQETDDVKLLKKLRGRQSTLTTTT
jgi:hypothetical protein